MWASKNNKCVYLDNASTTQVDERVIEAMIPFYNRCFGNPSSIHSAGSHARHELENCRSAMANLIGASASEIIFTSSGTEANNLALSGVASANRNKGNHIVVSAIEHDSVLNSCKWLQTRGYRVTYLPVNNHGIVNPSELNRVIGSDTILVSVMHVNNETGSIQPINELGEICFKRGVYFHTDACQSFGKLHLNVREMGISLMSINSHKIHGPKGIACLFVKEGVSISPIFHGGGQEFGKRPSTENLPGIVGFVKAAELCFQEMNRGQAEIANLRDHVINCLRSRFSNLYLNGSPGTCLPNIINFGLGGLEGETIRLLLLLDEEGIAVSTGSACSNNDTTKSASHVLRAMNRNQFESRGAIRLSLGRFNTREEVDYFVEKFAMKVKLLNPIFS